MKTGQDEIIAEDSMEDEDKENQNPYQINHFLIDGKNGNLFLIAHTEGFMVLNSYFELVKCIEYKDILVKFDKMRNQNLCCVPGFS